MLKTEISDLFNDYENTLNDCLDVVLKNDVPFTIGFTIDSSWIVVFPSWAFKTLPQPMVLHIDSETISESMVKNNHLVIFIKLGQIKNSVQLEIPIKDINSIEIPGWDIFIRTPLKDKVSKLSYEQQLNLIESSFEYLVEINSPLREGAIDVG